MRKLALILVMCLAVSLFACAAGETAWDVKVIPEGLDSRTVRVELPGMDRLSNNYHGDRVRLLFQMSYDRKVIKEESRIVELSEFDDENSYTMELPYFGKWMFTAEYMTGDVIIKREKNIPVNLGVTKVNFMDGVATTDVLIEALKWFTEDGSIDTSIPTIVNINRYRAFDYDNLPENMYTNPLMTDAEIHSNVGYWVRADWTKQYVKELLEINPDTYFNFYVSDIHLRLLAPICYYNHIPDGQYSITLVTDGSATYTVFRDIYNGENGFEMHENYMKEFEKFRASLRDGSLPNYDDRYFIRRYIYALLDVEEAHGNPARWWVVRKSGDTFGLPDAEFQAKVLADPRITSNYINNLLSAVSAAGNDEGFKQLYSFDDEIFGSARNEGKKLMMFIGTSAALEKTYPPFDYMQFLITYFGDEYAYYYKGHPGNYTLDSESVQQPYKDMGVNMLDASIAAELFMYFNPDICVAGYESTLYQNIGDVEQDVALFRRTYETAMDTTNLAFYADKMDIFIADMTDTEDTFTFAGNEKALKVLEAALKAVPEEEAGDRNYLVEFNNTSRQVNEYDFAIWNASKGVIRYLAGSVEEGLSPVE